MKRITAILIIVFVSYFGLTFCPKLPPEPVPDNPNELKPILVAPADNANTDTLRPKFIWRAIKIATGYDIQLDSKQPFGDQSPIFPVRDTTFTPSDDLKELAYYWRVRGVNDMLVGNWAEPSRLVSIQLRLPKADFTVAPNSGFSPLTVTFTDQSRPGTRPISIWRWDFEDNGSIDARTQGPHTKKYELPLSATTSQTFVVKLVVSDGVKSDSLKKFITVNPTDAPVADFEATTPKVGFAPLTVTFEDRSKKGTNDISSWEWDFDNNLNNGNEKSTRGPHNFTYNQPGTYTVKLTVSDGTKSDSETKANFITVTVPAAPVADFSANPTSGTVPLAVTFTDLSVPGSRPITSWEWDFDNNGIRDATGQGPHNFTYTQVATYSVKLTVSDGILPPSTTTKQNYIQVNEVPPVAEFTGSPTSGTKPLTVQFIDASTGVINSRSWNFGDGQTSTTQNPSHIYSNAGTYTVILTATGPGGSNIKTRNNYITVEEQMPEVEFTGSPTSGTKPLTVQFIDASTGVINSRSWNFGDGQTSTTQNPSHIYSNAGTYTVMLTVAGPGGSKTRTRNNYITVAEPTPAPVAEFTGSPTSGTKPLTVQFTDGSTGVINSRLWNFGDGQTSTAQSPSHIYSNAGTYAVTLTVTGPGGSNTRTRNNYIIVSEPPPVAEFAGSPTSGPKPLTVQFTDASTGVINSRAWNFGDGQTSTAQSPSYVYNNAGTYTVTLTVTGPGGPNTRTRNNYITVTEPAPVAEFAGLPTSGTKPLTVQFTDASTGVINSRAWNFGDGQTSTAQSPSYVYNNAGTYTVTLTVTGPGGPNTRTRNNYITVTEPTPVAEFAGLPTSGPKPLTVQFTDASTGAIDSRLWNFGDTQTSTDQSPSHIYTNAGTYTVILTATGPGGLNTKTRTGYITVTN